MKGEAEEVGDKVSIVDTCGWRGSCEQQELWTGAGEHRCGGHLEVS